MPLEIETKLTIPDIAMLESIATDPRVLPLLEDEFGQIQLSAVYYDTSAGLLSSRRWALRMRREDGCCVTAFKMPGDSRYTRREWQCQTSDLHKAVQFFVAEGAPPELAGEWSWQVRCTAEITRRRGIVKTADGLRAELALDMGTLSADDRIEPVCELELELLEGSEAQLEALTNCFQHWFGLIPQPLSKIARAMALRSEEDDNCRKT